MKSFAVIAGVLMAGSALAFYDDFNTENGGSSQLNFGSFNNWTVSDGTVDLIANGFGGLSGSGMFVDLDGSSGNAGKMTSVSLFVTGGVPHDFSFNLSGNQRGGSDDVVNVTVGSYVNMTVTKTPFSGWTNHYFAFTPTSDDFVTIVFDHSGGDNLGALLDNVSLNPVPEPATVVALSLGAICFVRKRSRR